ncbi:hypothetical protein [Streptomyces sp. IMTB 1903]|uniref:hypothetical protein n=1 Tax=Streptomyces sp. IMTB 1903 TaxID=1776680 RepID=UPI0007528708|nr:hypothetical protein [Streptomyces sp. IMTB 1903]
MTHATTSLPVHASTELDIFDADQRTRVPAAAGLAALTPALTPRAVRVLGQIEQAQQDYPEMANFLGLVAQGIRDAGDSAAILDEVLQLMQEQRTAPPAPCPAYSWCAETGDHDEHFSLYITAPTPDAYGRDVVPVGLIDWGKGVKVGLLDLDLTPAEARAKLAELRAHLDHVEGLIALAEQGATGPAADIEHARAGQ